MKHWIALILIILLPTLALAKDVDLTKDFDSLGANKQLIERARALDPENRVRIVQNRSVDRNLRLELGLNYGLVGGGDPYYNTQNIGGQLDFHITPRWSMGVRYYNSYNDLSEEGSQVFEASAVRQERGENFQVPDVDYPVSTGLVVLNWYPLYGKLNLFDAGISQFDVYTLVGAGSVELSSGPTETYAAGVGVGFWLSQHFSTRLEVRYQTYEDQVYTGPRRLHLTMGTATLGIML